MEKLSTEENDEIQDGKLQTKQETTDEELTDQKVMAGEALDRRNIWEPRVYYALGKESFHFAGHDISIHESIDTYGALIWPGAVALCQFLENNRSQVNLMDKAVLEIGAGTGLLSILASLLGAWVTATDLPDILPNLTFNLLRNTKGRSRYTPQVAALTWGQHLERDFPHLSCHYDYVLAADVVYHHDSLEELLETMRHFCRPGSRTTLLWANKIRFQSDLMFRERFESSFNTTLLTELPQQEVRIYQATAKE
ncbi:S-adenosylmethionine-dependent methyltransferase domain-containing protein isoform X2 [Hippoglossus hippoglossus]|uniref:S-adenosylmethionine-dependent methyltransferase domain-containing protein isoform X2 n=1 Tax=Hippoglossus hippoglossus TaxID=8267 RepID=UPI00148D6516|nr:S-adenosylmethionine-dependent methyltransferase domain-containing protein isoform X2 [Hippoglossus hippoglossus]